MKTLADVLMGAKYRRGLQPDSHLGRAFEPEIGHCEIHGKFELSVLEGGEERFHPSCPRCWRERRSKDRLLNAGFGERFLGCTFENYELSAGERQGEIFETFREYISSFSEKSENGSCVLLCGGVGTGKNHLAAAGARELLLGGRSVKYLVVSEFLDELWGSAFGGRNAVLRKLSGFDLLFLDEFGRHAETKGASDAVFDLLNARYARGKPSVIMTNLSRDALRRALGVALYSRMAHGGGLCLEFDWEDYRRRGVA